jgi:hypothetical protein
MSAATMAGVTGLSALDEPENDEARKSAAAGFNDCEPCQCWERFDFSVPGNWTAKTSRSTGTPNQWARQVRRLSAGHEQLTLKYQKEDPWKRATDTIRASDQ